MTATRAATRPIKHPLDHAHWMQDHLDQFGNRSLKQLTLPASHDSAMYLTGFPQSLGRTQNLSIYAQLAEGIRYFDLRPAWRNGDIFLHHDFIMGPKLDEVLSDVRRFMAENHRELVILKFSHYDAIDNAHCSTMMQQIQAKLASWLWTKPTTQRLAEIPLKEYLQSHGTVLIFCDGNYAMTQTTPGLWIYRDWDSRNPAPGDLRVFDQYANTTSYSEMKSDQFKKFEHYNGRCKARPDLTCDLFLLSWTLTPVTDVPAYAKEPNQRLANDIEELKIPNEFGCVVNLLYADCAETAKLTDIAIELNKQSRGVSPRYSN